MLIDAIYWTVALLLGPFIWLARKWSGKPSVPLRARLSPGPPLPPPDRPRVWVHAVSVGETLAARGLIGAIQARPGGGEVALTVSTVRGLEVARNQYPRLPIEPSPFDFRRVVRRALRRFQPSLLVLMELELWPNLLLEAQRAGVPVVVANARISARSLPRYRWLHRIDPGILNSISAWCVQDELHRSRVLALGVLPARVQISGNLKFDNARMEDAGPLRAEFRLDHGYVSHAVIVICASTHPGEEEALLSEWSRLRRVGSARRLVLAPRHPERVPSVLEMARRVTQSVGQRSRPGEVPDPEVLLVDTMGELARLYALADAAFVGGTLVPIGGHNLLEPAAFGLPILVGPHVQSVLTLAEELESEGVLTRGADAASVMASLWAWAEDPERGLKAREGAKRTLERHRGAVGRTMKVIDSLLPDQDRHQETRDHV